MRRMSCADAPAVADRALPSPCGERNFADMLAVCLSAQPGQGGRLPMVSSELRNPKNYVFGGTAAIVTEISLIVGLGSAGAGKGPIIGGLLTIALADNISDSLGLHMYNEAEGAGARMSVLATALNFATRLLVSLSFVAIVLLMSVERSVVVAVIWGLVLLTFVSFVIVKATKSRRSPALEIAKHLVVAAVVIVVSRYVGLLIAESF